MIDCFAKQFLAGDIFPHWCFTADAGLGVPLFLFYPPLAYYISSVFYPLTWLGVPLVDIYITIVWLASFVTMITAWSWLRDLISPTKALICAVAYLYLPYRMEVILFRSGYGELWALAFMPLVFKYSRRLILGDHKAIPLLALNLMFIMLCNMPAAVVGILGSGCYVALMALKRRTPIAMLHYGAALIWGAIMSAFYLLPAILYKPYITSEGVIAGKHRWSSSFVSLDNIAEGRGHVMLTIALVLMAVFLLAFICWHRRSDIPDPFIRSETSVWTVILLIFCFMLFSVSKPIWDHLGFISILAFPWRMQSVVGFALIYFLAIRTEWFMSPKQMKTWKADTAVLFGLIMLLSLFVVSSPVPEFVEHGDEMVASDFVTQPEYRTNWTDKPYVEMDYILGRFHHLPAKEKTLSGDTKIDIKQWSNEGIRLHIKAASNSEILLDHDYFPIWQVSGADGISLKPADKTGQMILVAPKGEYDANLSIDVTVLGWPAWIIEALSILSMIACIIAAGSRLARSNPD